MKLLFHLAFCRMDPNIFRKGEAESCLVVNKTWDDVVDKPYSFSALVNCIVSMVRGAEDIGLLTRATTLRELKTAINTILLEPLKGSGTIDEDIAYPTSGNVIADAYWDEIKGDTEEMEAFKEAVARAYNIKEQIASHKPLSTQDTLQTTKDNFNNTVVRPLLNTSED